MLLVAKNETFGAEFILKCGSLQFNMQEEEKKNFKTWLKRLGVAGFIFFLVKGLVWLAIFFFAGSRIFDSCN